ncbi:hypothetical protein [Elizabethkingia anophelis]|uniref:hypothetical protein n=1 Tax=Elizabethkingia anophelis TaxID=1117645 RepID=UPI001EE6ACF9|nr:hypothetical protein [Elizabethkingia anophelis]MDV3931289.1 hypothetical protein [Elizabethkingia anophelis]UKY87840.1 hypothetical protein KUF63_06315 [Elizabethkingia anophelis]UKZ01950.1 hypothetical protein KUF65_06320 [Elizabethkingia anophelis]
MIPQTLKNIKYIDFIVTDVFELGKILQQYGKIIFYSSEVIFDISNINPNLFSIDEFGEGIYFIQRIPESFAKFDNIKSDYDFKVGISDYNKFSNIPNLDHEPNFMDLMNDEYHPEFIESLKLELANARTEISCKIIYQDLLLHIEESNYFLKRNMTWGTEFSKEVQKSVYHWLLIYNSSLLSEINNYFKTIFPNEIKAIENNVTQIAKNKIDTQKENLRNTNIYRIASLFANGTISFEKMKATYENREYEAINELSDLISENHKFTKSSLQPYLNQTIKEITESDKNLFTPAKLKYLQLIEEDFQFQQKELSPFFKEKLQKLSQQAFL